MEQMTEQIKSVIQTVNANQVTAFIFIVYCQWTFWNKLLTDDFPIWFVQGGELDAIDGMTPLDMVVRILNNQLSSLMWIDEKVNIFYPDPFYLKNNVMFINLSFTIKCVQEDFHTN
jgi:nuclear pore complex protein Nup62